jgi:dienelactone hydrolase
MKKLLLAATALVAVSVLGGWPIGSAQAAVKVQTVDYKQGDSTLEGWLVYDDAKQGKRPGVVVFPAWNGPDEDAKGRAQMLAKLGYVAFVADVYGKGVRPADNKGAMAEATKYMKDRALLRDRAKAAFDALRKNAMVNPSKIAAIGYCFGGAGALDLARSGAPIVDTVAFHGDIASPTPQDDNNIKGRVLVLHGAADPIVGQKDQDAFRKEMTDAHVNWEMVLYGGAVHSFTQKGAGNDPSKGAAYNAYADKQSWAEMTRLFRETL